MQQGDGSAEESFSAMVKPRILSLPYRGKASGLGAEAVAFARSHGLELDDHQAFVLERGMTARKDGRWAYSEVGLCEPRQNGKSAILEARILAEVFLVRSELTIYSAHLYDTSMEIFRRLWALIEDHDDLLAEVKPGKFGRLPKLTHGQEGIEFVDDRRVRFRTRTKSAGRGFSCDCLLLDEAMYLPEETVGALVPTLSARPNPQVWYSGSAVDQLVHEHGVVFARAREKALEEKPTLAWFEWSVEGDNPETVPDDVAADPAAWAQANPAMGTRIDAGFVREMEFEGTMGRRKFAVERLGVGDWPRTDHETAVLDVARWAELEDDTSKLSGTVCFAFDTSPDRNSSIAVAGVNEAGCWHVEVVDSRRGTGWVPQRLAELAEKHKPAAVVCDGYGPAANLVDDIEAAGVEVRTLTAGEYAQACSDLVDAMSERTLRHRSDPELLSAIRAAQTRPLGDAWAWSRKNSSGNISPLVSATLALSAAMTAEPAGQLLVSWG